VFYQCFGVFRVDQKTLETRKGQIRKHDLMVFGLHLLDRDYCSFFRVYIIDERISQPMTKTFCFDWRRGFIAAAAACFAECLAHDGNTHNPHDSFCVFVSLYPSVLCLYTSSEQNHP